jgi:serine phosphatase RsbU (regulator of sigma subunit)
VEQEDAQEKSFETAPIIKILTERDGASAKEINKAVIAAFEAHRGGLPYLDDIALLTCRFGGE